MSSRPDFTPHSAKITRAERLGAQLAASIQSWAGGSPFRSEAQIADDRLSWDLVLRVDRLPPLDSEWAFTFGEAVHNLRSSLDNVSVGIARWAGVSDAKALKQTQFPISATSADWKGDKSRIKHLPAEFAAAIEAIQPFQRGETDEDLRGDLLLTLRDLDNQDKHHLQINPVLQPAIIHHLAGVEFETEADTAASVPPDVEVFPALFRDGEHMLRQRTKGRIAKVNGRFEVSAQVQVLLPDGRQEGITHLLAALCYYTRQVLEYVGKVESKAAA